MIKDVQPTIVSVKMAPGRYSGRKACQNSMRLTSNFFQHLLKLYIYKSK